MENLNKFIAEWTTDQNKVKPLFKAIYKKLQTLPETTLEYKGRPGVSHSLRAKRSRQKKRPLFILVDVIDDSPSERWLSICFYDSLVTDPEGYGDFIPKGLLGEDARCFDIDSPESMEHYIFERIGEAWENSVK